MQNFLEYKVLNLLASYNSERSMVLWWGILQDKTYKNAHQMLHFPVSILWIIHFLEVFNR